MNYINIKVKIVMKNLQKNIQYPDKQIDAQTIEKKLTGKIKIDKGSFVKNLGDNFYDTYIKQKFLGSGAYGTVHLITHRQLKIKRALKAIRKYNGARSTIQQLELLKKMDHPNILKIIEYFQTYEQWLIVTEYFEGKQLIQQVLDNKFLSEKKAATIVYEILKALNYIHAQNIAHRDIKAENVLVKKYKDSYEVKLIDWGFGSLVPKHNFQRKCGTSYYMAPEVVKGDYGLECDMWSLGILTFTMLCGHFPFGGKTSIQTYDKIQKTQINFNQPIWSQVSPQSRSFILLLLKKDVSKRLTAKQALEHPWIKGNLQVQQDQTETNLKETLNNLKEFYTKSKFQVIIINYITNFIELPKNESRLKKQFDRLDKDKDGTIGKAQFIDAYRKIYGIEADQIVEKIFEKVDIDGSGKISYSQFVTFGSRLKNQLTDEEFKEAFKLFDEDGDGFIDLSQISSLLESSLNSTQLPAAKIDVNNDGKIDEQQFLKYIKQSIKSSQLSTQNSNNKY